MSSKASIFTTLPGIEVPIADVSPVLADMWETSGDQPPSEFRATQMNLILHFGMGTEPEEAARNFITALRFSQRYPSRIIVLCPEDHSREETLLSSKVFSECYIGKSGRDRSCCEAVILAYPAAGKDFLENQVSILLETDLPTYYWQHRFQKAHRVTDYRFFLEISRRVVYDSRRESFDVKSIRWPRPGVVRDLTYASLLPVRQSVGQFLSGIDPKELVDGLTEVTISSSPGARAEASCLLSWVRGALLACARSAGAGEIEAGFGQGECAGESGFGLEIRFDYRDGRFFRWIAHRDLNLAEIDADFGRGKIHLPTSLKLLSPEAALAEAFFF